MVGLMVIYQGKRQQKHLKQSNIYFQKIYSLESLSLFLESWLKHLIITTG